jgi:site-specific recombinase XerD
MGRLDPRLERRVAIKLVPPAAGGARPRLPLHCWHRMRHCFGTHATRFGVKPWRLQSWMGHKRMGVAEDVGATFEVELPLTE